MYNKENPTFRYKVNTYQIGQDFREHSRKGKYITYVSSDFYGAVIRSKKTIERLNNDIVAMSVRLKGRGGDGQNVTGIKMDLIEQDDRRVDQYGLVWNELPVVSLDVHSNIPGNIILNPQPTLLTAFFYKNGEGSSFINFIEQ